MEKAMDKLLSDRELAENLGAQARKVQERFAPERVNRQWQAYFEKLRKE